MSLCEIEVFNVKRDFYIDGDKVTLNEPEIQKTVIDIKKITGYKETTITINDVHLVLLEIEIENGFYEFVDLSIEDMNKIVKYYTGKPVLKAKDLI